MTATLPTAPVSKSPSRRALLAGALGGLGALAASAIGRASPVRAGVDGDVVLGASNNATVATSIANTSNTNTVFGAISTAGGTGVYGSSGSNVGVIGQSNSSVGVSGQSGSGNGVQGTSSSSIGVLGTSSSSIGVKGTSPSYYGVQGISGDSYGVLGTSTSSVGSYGSSTSNVGSLGWSSGNSTGVLGASGAVPAAKAKTGVYGYAAQDIYSSGVIGESPAGVGVRGHTTTGYAGYFEGRVYTNAFYELTEISTPASPLSNRARLFAKDNGLGKTQLCVKFANGTVKILTTEG